MKGIPSLREKCTGALVASAIGDALGWPYELRARNSAQSTLMGGDFFIDWTRRTGGRYWGHDEIIRAGEYSDDTQMILAVARSIISEDWKKYFSTKELPFWLDYERGGGTALKRAAKAYRNNKYPWEDNTAIDYFNAGGNGTVMRILPHVIAHAYSQSLDQLMRDVIVDSTITHGHPRAILGATCYAYALRAIMRKNNVLQFGELIDTVIAGAPIWGKYRAEAFPAEWANVSKNILSYDYAMTWSSHVDEMTNALYVIKDSLKKGLLVNDRAVLTKLKCFDKESGAGDVAILSALYLASKYANNPVLGIKTAAYTIGMDTDTIASITGGLLGMLCGTTWIPFEWRSVQDYVCICNIAEYLLSDNKKETAKEITEMFVDIQKYQDTPIGKMQQLDEKALPSGKSGRVIISRWKTLYGQTVYFKKLQRINQEEQISMFDENGDLTKQTEKTISNESALILDCKSIKELLANSAFSRITFKKILQIAEKIIAEESTVNEIANSLKVDVEIVNTIKQHIM